MKKILNLPLIPDYGNKVTHSKPIKGFLSAKEKFFCQMKSLKN